MNRAAVRKKAEVLRRADVTEGIREHCRRGELTPVDGAQMLVKHIRGEIEHERTVMTKDGVEKITRRFPRRWTRSSITTRWRCRSRRSRFRWTSGWGVAKALISEQAPQIPVRELKPADKV